MYDTWGKIRAMINYDGKMVNEALPSMPVEILGMNNSAYAGAEFMVTENEDEAKKLSEFKKITMHKSKFQLKIKLHCLRTPKIKMNLTSQ